ncbi:MAG: UDP-2,4-diacetamido-2,4,6-trideoxy-beta-L-altropyranose hydrolase [Candidatus Omnitrophica bacterium]|nr:UDP-2,4-diacetamido-2,4,6-trideoxy-beta-L-altropyranose hydrolase [Candidatus Omnitrophota bacterium]
MKAVILTEGSKDIGFGHITRCLALYEAFKDKNVQPVFIINGDSSIKYLLREKKYQLFNWLKEKNKLFNILREAGIVVIDSYLASRDLYNKISEIIPSGILAMVDDYNRIKYPEGIVINPSIYMDRLNYPQKEGMVYLLGKDYVILRKAFQKIPVKRINKKARDVLIMFGGINHSALMHKIIDYLEKIFDFNFYVVEPMKNRLSARRVLNLMLNADICISGGGQTTHELARVGVPTIGVCFAKNQRRNLKGWQENGFIEYAGWHNDNNVVVKIKNAIEKLMPYAERVRRNNIGRKFVDGKGSQRIIHKLLHNN